MAERQSGGILTVSQLSDYIKMLFDNNSVLKSVYVRGEISGFRGPHSSGHLYFKLKDNQGLINVVMFRSGAERLGFIPEEGMRVVIKGKVSVYPASGQYQLYAEDIEPDGIGALYMAYEQLKKKLEAEGLFDQSVKKAIPYLPSRIGIITSPTGAAICDMINITGRRFKGAEIVLFPSLVQGEGAESQLTCGIEYFNSADCKKPVDVIIIGRGGGSIEDLWAFNSEKLARAIRKSDIPVISAVGHETDYTICDFAADLRAPTPSAAAELAVPDENEIRGRLLSDMSALQSAVTARLKDYRARLDKLSSNKRLSSPFAYLDDRKMRLADLSDRLEKTEHDILEKKKDRLSHISAMLSAVSPLNTIARGYCAVFGEDGTLIKSVDGLSVGDKFRFRASDGEVGGEVLYKKKDDLGEGGHIAGEHSANEHSPGDFTDQHIT